MTNLLLTGASGFLGQIILKYLDGKVVTLGRTKLKGNHITSDLQTIPGFKNKFDTVIHNAGKAHIVPRTEEEKEAFLKVNYQGTKNLLAALSKKAPKQFIFISTIAVYGLEKGIKISEKRLPVPNTPYGESKWLAEKAVLEWAKENKVQVIILRLPLVVGSNPPGNLGAIKNAIKKGYYLKIKNNTARKSMVLAEDIARLITLLPKDISGTYNLTDGVHPTFQKVEQAIEARTEKKSIQLSPTIVKTMARVGDFLQILHLPSPLTSIKYQKIISSLTFDDTKARKELNWNPRPVIPFIEKHL